MELSGEEKKLQALFSELKAADEQSAPRFAGVWNRAQLAPRRVRAFSPAFVGVAALIVCALISLVIWSRYSETKPQRELVQNQARPAPSMVVISSPGDTNASGAHQASASPIKQAPKQDIRVASSRINARRQTELAAASRKLTQDAKTMANWQSPTSALLTSPSDELFSSLPQVNQNSTDLKSFLVTRSN